MCTGMIARVRCVMAASTAAGSRFSERSSISANTGVARSMAITLDDEMNEKLRGDHLVPGPHAVLERRVQAGGSAGAGDRVPDANAVGERPLERRHHRSLGEASRAQDIHHQLALPTVEVRAARVGSTGLSPPPQTHPATGAVIGYSSMSSKRASGRRRREEHILERLGDRAPAADLVIVDRRHRSDLGRRAAQEHLVGEVQVSAHQRAPLVPRSRAPWRSASGSTRVMPGRHESLVGGVCTTPSRTTNTFSPEPSASEPCSFSRIASS